MNTSAAIKQLVQEYTQAPTAADALAHLKKAWNRLESSHYIEARGALVDVSLKMLLHLIALPLPSSSTQEHKNTVELPGGLTVSTFHGERLALWVQEQQVICGIVLCSQEMWGQALAMRWQEALQNSNTLASSKEGDIVLETITDLQDSQRHIVTSLLGQTTYQVAPNNKVTTSASWLHIRLKK